MSYTLVARICKNKASWWCCSRQRDYIAVLQKPVKRFESIFYFQFYIQHNKTVFSILLKYYTILQYYYENKYHLTCGNALNNFKKKLILQFPIRLLVYSRKNIKTFELDNVGKKRRDCRNVKILIGILL